MRGKVAKAIRRALKAGDSEANAKRAWLKTPRPKREETANMLRMRAASKAVPHGA